MRLRERFKAFNKRLNNGFIGPGDLFDFRTYKGNFWGFLFWVVATYFLLHLHDLLILLLDLEGTIDDNPAKKSWSQLWAWIIGGTGMVSTLIAMILIPIKRSERIMLYLGNRWGLVWLDDVPPAAIDAHGHEPCAGDPGPADSQPEESMRK